MKNLESIIEDDKANVLGALTSEGRIMLPEGQKFPRADLLGRARELAAVFGVTIPEAVEAKLPPADPA